MPNPLLTDSEFTPYSQIQAEHIVPAVQEQVKLAQIQLDLILDGNTNDLRFETVHTTFIELEESLERVWTPIENLLSLAGSPEIRAAAEEARPILIEFYNNYSLNEKVYQLIKRYDMSPEAQSLTGERRRYHQESLRDLRLSGAELEGEAKDEFKQLNLELAELCQKFSDNVTDSKFDLIITEPKDLSGLAEDIIEAAKHAAQAKNLEGWLFTLDYPSYGPFMKFADNRELRKKFYIEYLSKASSPKHPEHDNNQLIPKICRAKTRKAELLGFKNFAEYSLCNKMAAEPNKVLSFLENLATAVKPLAEAEYKALVDFNNSETVFPWDKDYISEKLRKAKYNLDSNELKQYFELENSISGMFQIAERLFDIRIQASSNPAIEVWHPDVSVYELFDSQSQELIGYFYMDLFPRDNKRQGAWMMPLVQSHRKSSTEYRPAQCVLACNLNKPLGDRPSLLTHLELTTLFHEFGHGLHHLLSRTELAPLAGTNVEWDFVELPSQLMENFCWEAESLALFAKQYQSSQSLDPKLLSKLIEARKFNEGLSCMRQLEFALFDMRVYMRGLEETSGDVNLIYRDIVQDYGVFPAIPEIHFPASFSHIFAGGYAAGYYSYKWAEALEADAFSRFRKEGVLNPSVGKAYRTSILEKGDSEPPMDLFRKFMGREPREEALLERIGVHINAT